MLCKRYGKQITEKYLAMYVYDNLGLLKFVNWKAELCLLN